MYVVDTTKMEEIVKKNIKQRIQEGMPAHQIKIGNDFQIILDMKINLC